MSTTHLERLQEEITSIAQPLVTHYNEVGVEITRLEKELADLRGARTQLAKTIRSINPDLIEPYFKNGKPGKKKSSGANDPSQERVNALLVWLQEHKEELNANGGFYSTGLHKVYGAEGTNELSINHQSGISKALRKLHDQGVIRLDHEGTGGSKFYKVI